MKNNYFLNPKNFKSKDIIEEDHRYVLGVGFGKKDIVFISGNGCVLKDLDGKEYLDFVSGTGNVSTGHGNKYIIDAMKEQLDLFAHNQMQFTNIPKVKVAKLIVELFPKKAAMRKLFTAGSGSEVNETMIKLAKKFTAGKNATKFISWWESYHGQTIGALSATNQKIAKAAYLEPLYPEFLHVPMPYCYNCAFGKKYPSCKIHCAKYVKDLIEVEGSEKFAGMLFEPISSALGGVVPPKEYFEIIYEICDKENIVLMFDEVYTGFGRTGKMFGCEHYDIYPKMLTLGKSLVSGYATISGLVVNNEIEGINGFGDIFHGFTCSGSAISNAAVYANIKFIIENNLVKNSKEMGDYLFEKISPISKKYPKVVGEIRRTKGLLGSIVFKREVIAKEIELLAKKAFEKGLIIYANTRVRDNLIFLVPPLIIKKEEIDFAVEVILKSFEEVFNTS